MKKLLMVLMVSVLALLGGCSSGQMTDDDAALLAAENVGSQEQLACYGKPVATDWAGCRPGIACASPPSVTGIEWGDVHTGGTTRQFWVYYNGVWQKAVDLGNSSIDIQIIGSIPNHGLPLRKIYLTNFTYGDGPGAKIKAECMNPNTGVDECHNDEIAVHGAWFETPKTCTFGLWTSGLTRVVGLGDTTGEGDISLRGYNTVSGVTSYVSCDFRLKNACSGP